MIEKIQIKNIATYDEQSPGEMSDLGKINFIYGSNGTGKTTISRVIADVDQYPGCSVTWRGGAPLETLVYNRDFVEKNFNQSAELRGIFTLGEEDKEILEKIAAAKKELEEIKDFIDRLNNTLQGDEGNGGKVGELGQLEEDFTEQCWRAKQNYDQKFRKAFSGVHGSKKSFKERLLRESIDNQAVPASWGELERRAETVFGETPQLERPFTIPDWKGLIAHEDNPILKKKIIGKSDVDIAAMIDRLGNSDWVKQGRRYYDKNERVCPFCQQETNASLEKSLNEYFDEAFRIDSTAIEKLCEDYGADSERLCRDLRALLDAQSERLDTEKLRSQIALLESKTRNNLQRIEEKRREPSKSVELDSLSGILDTIEDILEAANAETQKHNKMVENIRTETTELSRQVWRHLLDHEIRERLTAYNKKKAELEKARDNLQKKREDKTAEKNEKIQQVTTLEKETTSIQPTINAINSLLISFGFEGFVLAKSERDRFYKIQRSDGSDAKETLSEGERSFIALLYFYHLVKGSESESRTVPDRVVVFDDPVSSLDSDVLFVVSSLIRNLFQEVREKTGQIKQVFVLTHNAYFHKEVSFDSKRRGGQKLKDETFWTVKKLGLRSKIENHKENPIKNTYGLLWMEIKKADLSGPSLQNTMRRILEYYFRILGNLDYDTILANFEGQEKLICGSLFSWVNAGSHSVHEDLHFSPDESTTKTYLDVFENIFRKTGHLRHYEMMMGDITNGHELEG